MVSADMVYKGLLNSMPLDLEMLVAIFATFMKNAYDYVLNHFNVDMETLAPYADNDPQLGVSFRDIRLSVVEK